MIINIEQNRQDYILQFIIYDNNQLVLDWEK